MVAFALLTVIAVGIPLLERWLKCWDPVSEACVWAKAYLPLSFGLWAVAGLVAAGIAWAILGARK